MAIWQYKIFILPREEVESYFDSSDQIPSDAFDALLWWRYRQILVKDLVAFKELLKVGKSWSKSIYLLGKTDSNCIEAIFNSNNIIEEISARLDLRIDYYPFLETLCKFGEKHDCVFMNTKFSIIPPKLDVFLQYVRNDPSYRDFLDRFGV